MIIRKGGKGPDKPVTTPRPPGDDRSHAGVIPGDHSYAPTENSAKSGPHTENPVIARAARVRITVAYTPQKGETVRGNAPKKGRDPRTAYPRGSRKQAFTSRQ